MNVCVDRYGKRSGGEWRIARPQTASSTTAKRRLILQKKKKYYQFITSLLLEEPLCTAWLTSARARPTRAEGRAQQRGPRPGPAVQGRRGQPGSRLPLPCPPPRPSAKGLSSGEEGWRAEGVYSPACRTRFSWGGGVRRQGHHQLWHHQLCHHLSLGHIPSFILLSHARKLPSWMP